ncbi:MAG: flippase-like domain-containing protein [candidate division KSB1 bacterium]|nr:flippase-like domain-containing protein [candidate division KSB1 bacterium]
MNAKPPKFIFKKAMSILMGKVTFRKVLTSSFVIAVLVAGYFIVRNFDQENIMNIKNQINYFYFIWGLMVIFIVTLLRIVRWLVLLKPIKPNISFLNIMEIYSSSQVFNYVAPGKWAIPARAFFLKQLEAISITQSIPSLMSELFLDISGMFGLLMIIAIMEGYFYQIIILFQKQALGISMVFFSLCILSAVGFFFFKKKGHLWDSLFSAIKVSFKQRKYFFMALILTCGILLLSFFGDMLVLRALGLTVPYHFIVMAFSFSTIMGLLSPLPAGIGVNELSNAYFFKLFYNTGELALIGTFLRRVLDYLILILLFASTKLLQRRKLTFPWLIKFDYTKW